MPNPNPVHRFPPGHTINQKEPDELMVAISATITKGQRDFINSRDGSSFAERLRTVLDAGMEYLVGIENLSKDVSRETSSH